MKKKNPTNTPTYVSENATINNATINNATIKVAGINNRLSAQIDGYDRLVEYVRTLDDTQIKKLEIAANNKNKELKQNINILLLRSGREVSKKGYEKLASARPEKFVEAEQKWGYYFEQRVKTAYDPKTGDEIDKEVYYSPEAENMRRALDPDDEMSEKAREEFTPQEIINSIYTLKWVNKKLINTQGYKSGVDNLKRAIKQVRHERECAELKAKGARRVSIVELGKRLLTDSPVQEVNPIPV